MEFIFKAKDQKGAIKDGKVEAIDRMAAIRVLQKQGLVPISVQQEKQKSETAKEIQRIFEGVSDQDLVVFFEQLSILVEAKVPIVSSLDSISEQIDNNFLKTVVDELKGDIEDGRPLSEALSSHPNVFTPLMINMVRSGEVSGNLQESIKYIAENIEKSYQLKSKIKSAMYYPAVVLAVTVIVGFIVVTVILPKLTGIIKDLDVEIPWYTAVLISIGDFMAAYWWVVILFVGAIIGGTLYYAKTEDGKKEWDRMKLKIPVVGKLLQYVYMARFADNFAILLVGGIPVVRALMIVSDVINNSVYRSIILRAADEVKAGGNISTIFAKSADIPPMVTRMVSVGEETGKLSEILRKVATHYELEADKIARNLSTLIEPVMIVILGFGVAIMAFGILLPIYNIAGQL